MMVSVPKLDYRERTIKKNKYYLASSSIEETVVSPKGETVIDLQDKEEDKLKKKNAAILNSRIFCLLSATIILSFIIFFFYLSTEQGFFNVRLMAEKKTPHEKEVRVIENQSSEDEAKIARQNNINWEEEPTEEMVKQLPLDVRIGQLLMVKVSDVEQTNELVQVLRSGLVGGVLVNRSFTHQNKAIQSFTNWLQSNALTDRAIPLFIASDDEGGRYINYPNLQTEWPNLMGIGAVNDEKEAFNYGEAYGRELRALGFNLVFSPVLDVNSNPDNPIIGVRSLGSRPEEVSRLGVSVFKGFEAAGMIAVGKHFPGHGDTSEDSHVQLPVVKHGYDRLEEFEFPPFMSAIREGIPALMTAHVAVPAVDSSNNPATLSRVLLQEVLRKRFGFEGVIVSDSLNMEALKDIKFKEEGESGDSATGDNKLLGIFKAAFKAGVDVVLETGTNYVSDISHLFRVHRYLMREVEVQAIDEDQINQSVLRVLRLKYRFGLYGRYPVPESALSVLRCERHSNMSQRFAEKSINILRNDHGLLPLSLPTLPPPQPTLQAADDAARSTVSSPAPLPPVSILIITPGEEVSLFGNVFSKSTIHHNINLTHIPISHEVSQQEMDKVMARVNEHHHDYVLLFFHHYNHLPCCFTPLIYPAQVELGTQIYNKIKDKVIVISVENPYDLFKYPPFPTHLIAYNSRPVTLRAIVSVLMGKITANTHLPIDLERKTL
eukprot:TRINITY_DN3150_c0_g1_i1.p1 TRINITY_DN3150_c0_g1~~TRINITY_DN3150_c0_g1_i1.p1  ORF type:complete len:717 (-),score=122.36 TRINITY_DN3150_c0_g1_i1:1001-3151(-)